jgi:hypothetical protein
MTEREHEHDEGRILSQEELDEMEGAPEPEPEPEPEPDEDEETEGEPGEPQAETDADTFPDSVQTAKKLDQLQKHVSKRIGEILGEAANNLVQCELCTWAGTPGWRPNVDVPEQIVGDVLHAIGYLGAGSLQDDQYSQTCGMCAGFGQVATGSKVAGQEALPCITCHGMGWTPVGNERASVLGRVPNGALPAAPVTPEGDAAPQAPPEPEPPEAAALRAAGYMVFPPVR